MSKPKPVSETIMPWLRANLGKQCLAPLTSTDVRALRAAVQIIELYSQCDDRHAHAVLAAFRLVLSCMQPQCLELAYHAIAHVLDWEDRQSIWTRACLPILGVRRRCAFEPGGSGKEFAP